METIEYSVCVDCLYFVEYGDVNHENETAESMAAHVDREVGDTHGHFVTGVAPTEDDPDGNGENEFSWSECELCRSHLGGARHGVTLLIRERKHYPECPTQRGAPLSSCNCDKLESLRKACQPPRHMADKVGR